MVTKGEGCVRSVHLARTSSKSPRLRCVNGPERPSIFLSFRLVPLSPRTGISPLIIYIASLSSCGPHGLLYAIVFPSRASFRSSPRPHMTAPWPSTIADGVPAGSKVAVAATGYPVSLPSDINHHTMRLNPAIKEDARVVARHIPLASAPGDSRCRHLPTFLESTPTIMSLQARELMVRHTLIVFSDRHSPHVNRPTLMLSTAPSNTEEMKMSSRPRRFPSSVTGPGESMAQSLTPTYSLSVPGQLMGQSCQRATIHD